MAPLTKAKFDLELSPSVKNDTDNFWTTQCMGMPTLQGCRNEVRTSKPYVRTGLKGTGWLICFGLKDENTEDEGFVCAFCPTCVAIMDERATDGAP